MGVLVLGGVRFRVREVSGTGGAWSWRGGCGVAWSWGGDVWSQGPCGDSPQQLLLVSKEETC